MKVDGIGFDYGNTLVDDPFEKVMKLKALDFVRVLEANGYEIAGKKFVKAWSGINAKMNFPHCSHFAQEIPFVKALLESLGVKKTDRNKLSQQLLVTYRSGLKYVLKNDPGLVRVKEVLAALRKKGKKLFILSNEKVDTLNAQLEWTDLAKFFDRIIASKRVGVEKPDPQIFNYMIKAFDMPKERILYVGDDPQRDIKPAKQMGLRAVMLQKPAEMSVSGWRDYSAEFAENEKPDYMIKNLSELLGIIQ